MGALTVIAFAILAIAGYLIAHARVKALQAVAARLGLQFSARDPFALDRSPFALMRLGGGRRASNVMHGTYRGVPIHAFDYRYVTESGEHETTYRHSCVIVTLEASCPHLTLAREGLLSSLADVFGFRDIELESEEFNRAFQIKCDDKRFAYAILDARMMAWLLDEGGDCAYEVSGSWILCNVRRLRPESVEWLVERAMRFRTQVPEVVASLYPVR